MVLRVTLPGRELHSAESMLKTLAGLFQDRWEGSIVLQLEHGNESQESQFSALALSPAYSLILLSFRFFV